MKLTMCCLILVAAAESALGQPNQGLMPRPEHMRAVIPILSVQQTPYASAAEARYGHQLTIDSENRSDFISCKKIAVKTENGLTQVKKTCRFRGPRFRIQGPTSTFASVTWVVRAAADRYGGPILGSGSAPILQNFGSASFWIEFDFLDTLSPPVPTTYWVVLETVDATTGQAGRRSNWVRVGFMPLNP